ncbi:MAG: CtsR family transcriptional regulator [Synergistaceae bacterium]|nr:CtsR family transcriptional regulator [Synergistaceae bacterium]
MSNITCEIEKYIYDLLSEAEEEKILLRRKDLAEIFGCVPSQINYVLRSRFSPEHGFLIESRRGGQGYIKILRITCKTPQDMKSHIEDMVGGSIDYMQARRLLEKLQGRKLITQQERLLIEVALKNTDDINELTYQRRCVLMAKLLKNLLQNIILEEEDL